jgi:hypothetical protein
VIRKMTIRIGKSDLEKDHQHQDEYKPGELAKREPTP